MKLSIMEILNDFLKIVGFVKFIKSAYKWILSIRKNPNKARQKVNNYLYHRNSINIIFWFLIGSIAVLLLHNFLGFAIIWLKFNLSMKGFYFGFAFFSVFTLVPILFLHQIYNDHMKEVKRMNYNSMYKA
jgi:hypothetical protein